MQIYLRLMTEENARTFTKLEQVDGTLSNRITAEQDTRIKNENAMRKFVEGIVMSGEEEWDRFSMLHQENRPGTRAIHIV